MPSVTLKTQVRMNEQVEHKGKRVVVFALNGAFTPTFSGTHPLGYKYKYQEMKALGIDEVRCLSVNDAFVMRQCGSNQGLRGGQDARKHGVLEG